MTLKRESKEMLNIFLKQFVLNIANKSIENHVCAQSKE